ncbi:MAG TPA: asparagine synthase-related protein [Bacteroidales bacterium]|nr:asparagine synthase-related protein [Bacteroidales bacterium]
MPPVFGIIAPAGSTPDASLIDRMKRASEYVIPRKLICKELAGDFLGMAVIVNNPLMVPEQVVYEKGDWIIIADAALYKRAILREKLGIENESQSDAGLVLEAWIRYGSACMNLFYGDFAFVITNRKTGEIFCGRDHLGVRPLFYTFHKGSFLFASEIRYLVYALQKPGLRAEYFTDTLITVKSRKDQTPFQSVYRLKPGHYLHHKQGQTVIDTYWKPDPARQIQLRSEKDYIVLLKKILAEAVQIRCNPTAVMGSELSGGLDSSAVTGIANQFLKESGKQITTFSNLFPESGTVDFKDEKEFIKYMIDFGSFRWYGIDHHQSSIPEILKHSLKIHSCFIQQNFNIFSKSLYEKAGSNGIQVLLSGFGGDELVSARTSFPWNELIQKKQWRVIGDELFYKGVRIKTILKPVKIALNYFRFLLNTETHTSGVFTRDLLDKRFTNFPLKSEFSLKHHLRARLEENFRKLKRNTLSERQFDRIMPDHLPQRMEYCYTAAAQYGIEYRYPLLDLDVVETALAFPPWMKQHHGKNRYMFREAIRGFVPEEIRKRDDKTVGTIPQTLQSLVNDKDEILQIIQKASGIPFLHSIFDFSKFPEWYTKLAKRDPNDQNYLNPGAFYDYLMILLYYLEKPSHSSHRSHSTTENQSNA